MSADLSGAHWFKSTFSNAGGECVEIAHMDNGSVCATPRTRAEPS
ncbi:Domain of uncharacterised function (DUF397) [Mycobacteroides abscessus subsp. abscessus]|nr:Domain of uncharacterised function (DUF397) [Mycobacteroides abscessus subsp. abscessus]